MSPAVPQRESRWQWRIALGDRTISVQSGGAARTGITFPKLGAHLPAFKQPQPRQGWSRRKGKTPRICSETRRDSSPTSIPASRTPARSCHEIRPLFLPREGGNLPGPPPFPGLGACRGSLPDSPLCPRDTDRVIPTRESHFVQVQPLILKLRAGWQLPGLCSERDRGCRALLPSRLGKTGRKNGPNVWAGAVGRGNSWGSP